MFWLLAIGKCEDLMEQDKGGIPQYEVDFTDKNYYNHGQDLEPALSLTQNRRLRALVHLQQSMCSDCNSITYHTAPVTCRVAVAGGYNRRPPRRCVAVKVYPSCLGSLGSKTSSQSLRRPRLYWSFLDLLLSSGLVPYRLSSGLLRPGFSPGILSLSSDNL
ncbi:hypothetical protein J6590_038753 [Homalodisca vitripennis]|nr:hypothetical protein J6590_038753 [Homalodisca vitripennis]